MSITQTTGPAVRIRPAVVPASFVAFVPGDDGETRVRFTRKPNGDQWKCDEHGRHRFSTCAHEKAALAAWRARKVEAND